MVVRGREAEAGPLERHRVERLAQEQQVGAVEVRAQRVAVAADVDAERELRAVIGRVPGVIAVRDALERRRVPGTGEWQGEQQQRGTAAEATHGGGLLTRKLFRA